MKRNITKRKLKKLWEESQKHKNKNIPKETDRNTRNKYTYNHEQLY